MCIKTRFLLFILVGVYTVPANAQEVQWASAVVSVSSEREAVKTKGNFYQAVQALGRPNRLPQFGESILAWSPAKKKRRRDEFIKVSFAKPMRARQVIVGENFGAGSITQIYVYGEGGQKKRVYHDKFNHPVEGGGRVIRALFALTPFEVVAVKVILSTIDVKGYNQIDCIGITESPTPYKIKVNVSEEIIVDSVYAISIINSQFNEVMPIVSPDGLRLYFDRKNHPKNTWSKKHNDDIWYSEWNGKGWGSPIQLPKPLNNTEHNYVCSVTPDGKLLLGNRYTGSGGARPGVSMSSHNGNEWLFPEPLEVEGYYNYNVFSEFTISDNQKVLILSIERKDTFGDKDMYVSFLNEDGTWTLPKNMGATINTPMPEATPFLASDNKTLYFASSGYSSFGSSDIYVTRRLDSTWCNWSEPLNLGKTFNNKDWNGYFSLDAKGKWAYFVSAQDAKGNNMDIYTAKLPSDARPEPVVLVYGTVFNDKTKQPIGANVSYESLTTGQNLGFATSDSTTGAYKITLPYHDKYGIYASSKGFFSLDDFLDLDTITEIYTEIKKDLHLVPIEIGKSVRLNNVFFKQSKTTLLSESFPELDRLAKLIKTSTSMEITLEGHTDIVGNAKLNLKLSEARVETVKDYLVSKGVSAKRIKAKGYG
ncbi:MAG: outer membrane protein OmpA-like peptidoglycan-associated protein, partial [Arenicella sp.]